jgi:hypothetical protein
VENIPRNKSRCSPDLRLAMQTTKVFASRPSALIAPNVRWLRQALRLLERLDDTVYATTAPGLPPHRAGAHLRHVLEFYQCFLEGLDWSHIDYDARRRDESVERSRKAAAATIRSIIHSLQTHPEVRQERIVWVRMEDALCSGVRDAFMESSLSRELQVLSSHTIHHFALIAMTLRAHGVQLDADFGMAPSTLRHLAAKTAEAA